jgi:hypothetical protein
MRKVANKPSLIAVESKPSSSRSAMNPLLPLTESERVIFNSCVLNAPHLKPIDCGLLTAYARLLARAMSPKGAKTAEKDLRVAVLIARSLRLTPMSSQHAKPVARSRRDAAPSPLEQWARDNDVDD